MQYYLLPGLTLTGEHKKKKSSLGDCAAHHLKSQKRGCSNPFWHKNQAHHAVAAVADTYTCADCAGRSCEMKSGISVGIFAGANFRCSDSEPKSWSRPEMDGAGRVPIPCGNRIRIDGSARYPVCANVEFWQLGSDPNVFSYLGRKMRWYMVGSACLHCFDIKVTSAGIVVQTCML